MPTLTPAALRTQLDSGNTAPLYLLLGADDVEKSATAGEFASMVDEGLRAFNVDRFHGAEAKVDTLIDVANTLPMMAPRRIVIVLDAEKFLIPKRDTKAAEEEIERLMAFLQAPPPHASIVFVCGPIDQRRRITKLLMKDAYVVTCGAIADAADAERWLRARAERADVRLEPAAVRALIERSGLDLPRLRANLDRVALYALGQPVVTAEDVRAVTTAGPEAQEDFGIAKAIWRNDVKEALRELGRALDAGAVPFMLLGQLRAAAEKLAAPRIKPGIDAVLRTDLALKSSGGAPRTLLERLVVELCGAPSQARPLNKPFGRR